LYPMHNLNVTLAWATEKLVFLDIILKIFLLCKSKALRLGAYAEFWEKDPWIAVPHFQQKILPYGARSTLRSNLDHIRVRTRSAA
jgi:hypothetical protein